jgi:hypothetical protein
MFQSTKKFELKKCSILKKFQKNRKKKSKRSISKNPQKTDTKEPVKIGKKTTKPKGKNVQADTKEPVEIGKNPVMLMGRPSSPDRSGGSESLPL